MQAPFMASQSMIIKIERSHWIVNKKNYFARHKQDLQCVPESQFHILLYFFIYRYGNEQHRSWVSTVGIYNRVHLTGHDRWPHQVSKGGGIWIFKWPCEIGRWWDLSHGITQAKETCSVSAHVMTRQPSSKRVTTMSDVRRRFTLSKSLRPCNTKKNHLSHVFGFYIVIQWRCSIWLISGVLNRHAYLLYIHNVCSSETS